MRRVITILAISLWALFVYGTANGLQPDEGTGPIFLGAFISSAYAIGAWWDDVVERLRGK